MTDLFRFGISLPRDLLDKFDRLIKEKDYPSRSEAIRDLIRQELIKEQWQLNKEVAGAITLIYNHHKRELLNKVIDIQHNFQKIIISAQHIHLDHHNCLEIIALKGRSKIAKDLLGAFKGVKGIKHVTLSMSTTGMGI